MNTSRPSFRLLPVAFAVVALAFTTTGACSAAGAPALLDDFSDAAKTSTGAGRLLVDDRQLGSTSSGIQACADGVLTVRGSLVPGRGVPAFVSLVLLASPDGTAQDLSAFSGIRLRVKVAQGSISVQAGSAAIDNFDFHSGPIPVKGGEFQEIRIPFTSMKRAWSEQTPLDLATITSVNIVAFGLAKGDFAYELDEVGFY
ncbi:MAG: CIA30 family protein [Opitutaceae bacterium]|nr:CIA30 family protein [Opitutaceae bacterium]